MMGWLHTLQMHNFHETAARLKNAESASNGGDSSVKTNTDLTTEHVNSETNTTA